MDATDLIGNPLVVMVLIAVLLSLIAALAWINVPLRRVPPELVQLLVFRNLGLLRRGVTSMTLGLIIGMILLLYIFANVSVPEAVVIAGAIAAAILFWYGGLAYARVFRVPRAAESNRPRG